MYGKETLDFADIVNKPISEERRLKNGGRDLTIRDSTDSVLVVNEKRKKNVVCWRCGKAGHALVGIDARCVVSMADELPEGANMEVAP
ncbi:hypothetical protein V6N11_020614 [Hibiscus sabdariffa]|uniref:CCHC-type domain-containing protein n=1 Tax=Hibiscus sabdariffa TaxID=183260 RepID=A0ABR2Q8Y8_9ROSI